MPAELFAAALSLSFAAAPPEPPELASIRARYQRLSGEDAKGEDAWGVDKAGWTTAKDGQDTQLSLVGADRASEDGDRKVLAFARVTTQWSNLGTHKAEYLLDDRGELLFFYTSGSPTPENHVELRLYFAKGALLRVVDRKKTLDAPTELHRQLAERAQKEARRLSALFRELQATRHTAP